MIVIRWSELFSPAYNLIIVIVIIIFFLQKLVHQNLKNISYEYFIGYILLIYVGRFNLIVFNF